MAWLKAAADAVAGLAGAGDVTVYPPVPPSVAKVAGIERLQMLVEAPSRTRLQRLLADKQALDLPSGTGTGGASAAPV